MSPRDPEEEDRVAKDLAIYDEAEASGVARVEQAIEAARAHATLLRAFAIGRTKPSDWVDMGGGKLYLQDVGAQRVAQAWGISFGAPTMHTESTDGHYVVTVAGSARDHRNDREEHDVGGASTADSFWVKAWQQAIADGDPGAKIRLRLDVQRKAVTNLHGRLIRKLTGLNGIEREEIESYGVKPGTTVPRRQAPPPAKPARPAPTAPPPQVDARPPPLPIPKPEPRAPAPPPRQPQEPRKPVAPPPGKPRAADPLAEEVSRAQWGLLMHLGREHVVDAAGEPVDEELIRAALTLLSGRKAASAVIQAVQDEDYLCSIETFTELCRG